MIRFYILDTGLDRDSEYLDLRGDLALILVELA